MDSQSPCTLYIVFYLTKYMQSIRIKADEYTSLRKESPFVYRKKLVYLYPGRNYVYMPIIILALLVLLSIHNTNVCLRYKFLVSIRWFKSRGRSILILRYNVWSGIYESRQCVRCVYFQIQLVRRNSSIRSVSSYRHDFAALCRTGSSTEQCRNAYRMY